MQREQMDVDILIIGAAGQVGLSLIELCNKTNIKYIAISRRDLDIIDSFAVDLFFQRNHRNNKNNNVENQAVYAGW